MFVKEKVSYVLKDLKFPLFAIPVTEPLNETNLIIREEFLVEEKKEKVGLELVEDLISFEDESTTLKNKALIDQSKTEQVSKKRS